MIGISPPELPGHPAAQETGSDGLLSSIVDIDVATSRQGIHNGEQQFAPFQNCGNIGQSGSFGIESNVGNLDTGYQTLKSGLPTILNQPSGKVPDFTLEKEAMVPPQCLMFDDQFSWDSLLRQVQMNEFQNNQPTFGYMNHSMVIYGNEQLPLNQGIDTLAPNTHVQARSFDGYETTSPYGLQNYHSPSDLESLFLRLTSDDGTSQLPVYNVQATNVGAMNMVSPNNMMENLTIQDPSVSQGHSEDHEIYGELGDLIQIDEGETSTTPVNFQAMNEMAMDGVLEMENLRIQDPYISLGSSQGQQISNGMTQGKEVQSSPVGGESIVSRTSRRKSTPFSENEVNLLLEGVETYGTGSWTMIRNRYFSRTTRTPKDLKDKFINLTKMANNHIRRLRGARLTNDVFERVLYLNLRCQKA